MGEASRETAATVGVILGAIRASWAAFLP